MGDIPCADLMVGDHRSLLSFESPFSLCYGPSSIAKCWIWLPDVGTGRPQLLELEDHSARKANAGFCHSVAAAFVGDIPCADLMVGDTGADPSVLANLRASGRRSWPLRRPKYVTVITSRST